MIDPAIDLVRRRALQVDADSCAGQVLDLIPDAKLVLIGEVSEELL